MVLFKTREDAGQKLFDLIKKDPALIKNKKQIIIVSLLRGGAAIGAAIAKRLGCPHLPLVVAKISAPAQRELAVGAVCFDVTYTQKEVVQHVGIDKQTLAQQIQKAQVKFGSYAKRFGITYSVYDKVKGKIVVVVDDGIATGATARAAYLFLKNKQPKKIILAIPVSPTDFAEDLFDQVLISHKDPLFKSVSQYYEEFPQLTDEEVKKVMS